MYRSITVFVCLLNILQIQQQAACHLHLPIELRQDWGQLQESTKVEWFELFHDLIFVAVALKIDGFLSEVSQG